MPNRILVQAHASKYWHVRRISLRPRANEASFPPMRKAPLAIEFQRSDVFNASTSSSLPLGETITQPTKTRCRLGRRCEECCSQAYHCVEAAGGVAVRRGPLPLSFHLRLPTRVSRCDGMALLSCPAVTIILLCLFRYASTDRACQRK
jgi:hypothetical protein